MSGIICTFVNAYPNKKMLDYSYWEQWKDILPSVLLALVMGIIVYCEGYLPLKPCILLLIQIPSGIGLYVGLSIVLKLDVYKYFISTIKGLKK